MMRRRSNERFAAALSAAARMPREGRRRFLSGIALAAAFAGLPRPAAARTGAEASAPPWRAPHDPFVLGVASGAPEPDGVVLWTRLLGAGRDSPPLPPEPIAVRWEVADDERFAAIVRAGASVADPAWGHSIHVEVDGLSPGRWYFYRFLAGGAASPIGRTRTAPSPSVRPGRLRFALASCQNYEQGWYGAHRHMAEEDVDLVAFVGDYIYESSWGRAHVRSHLAGEPRTLAEYRRRYARYKSDADLARMHASAPWIVTWDDHEVVNDYADDRDAALDPAFLARRAAAYRAYYEHMPLRFGSLPDGPAMRLYGSHGHGALAEFLVLDARQYRSPQACQRPGRGGSAIVEGCIERLDPARTLLGVAQERWLLERLARSPAQWKFVAQQSLIAQLDHKPGTGQAFWTDGWDGYPRDRARLLAHLHEHRIADVVTLGGDVHSHWVCDLKPDFDDPRAPVVATELCGTSISSQGPSPLWALAALADNPHVRYVHTERRGYVLIEATPEGLTATLRAVDEKRPDTGVETLARFAVEPGRAGARRID